MEMGINNIKDSRMVKCSGFPVLYIHILFLTAAHCTALDIVTFDQKLITICFIIALFLDTEHHYSKIASLVSMVHNDFFIPKEGGG